MTIRPVSSVNFASGYNKVNFGGKRKNSENSNVTVPHRLAVPLAAAITFITLNIMDAKTNNNNFDIDNNNKIERSIDNSNKTLFKDVVSVALPIAGSA